jgi:RNA polymerase sigma-70 factor, ECF subfamily
MKNAQNVSHDHAQLSALMQEIVAHPTRAQQALGKLYDATVSALFTVALRLVRNRADAEDVICEVYKQVWERPRQYQAERGPVIAWLFIIVRTRALDLMRKRRDHVEWDATSLPSLDVASDAPSSADDLLQSMQENSAIRSALLQLSGEQRRMLDLAYFHDMSHQEIADVTKVALGTVKSHIRRGQQALQQLLEAAGFSGGMSAT